MLVTSKQVEVRLEKPKGFSISPYDIMQQEAPKRFLEAIGRKSKRTQQTYCAGLLAFYKFLLTYKNRKGKHTHTLSTILDALNKNEIDVYTLLDDFVSYLDRAKHSKYGTALTWYTINGYMVAVRSYLQFQNIDIIPHKFKRQVKMPTHYREDEEALDAADIRQILLSCSNRRLKPYLLILASAGLRASEALAMRLCDIDFSVHPVKVHVRKEYAKTRVSRDVYISDEAAKFLQEWLNWKYRKRSYTVKWAGKDNPPIRKDTGLIFTYYTMVMDPRALYHRIRQEFAALLSTVGLAKFKEGIQRRTITLHSFRRYVKTVISDQVSKDYSEWFLGHSKSPYYTMKEPMRREIYQTRCMRYLTFLDYSALESKGRNIEAKLEQKDEQISKLSQELHSYKEELNSYNQAVEKLRKTVEVLAEQQQEKTNRTDRKGKILT